MCELLNMHFHLGSHYCKKKNEKKHCRHPNSYCAIFYMLCHSALGNVIRDINNYISLQLQKKICISSRYFLFFIFVLSQGNSHHLLFFYSHHNFFLSLHRFFTLIGCYYEISSLDHFPISTILQKRHM